MSNNPKSTWPSSTDPWKGFATKPFGTGSTGFGSGSTGFGTTTSTTGTTSTFGTTTTTKQDITAGMSFNDFESDTINDICINDHLIVAAATWNGIKIWKNVPKVEETTSTTGFNSTPSKTTIPYNFESYDSSTDNQPLFNSHKEPVLRCTFDTYTNNVVYYGNAYGRIFRVYLESALREEYAGHQTSMITGLKYCRDKLLVASSSCDGYCYIWDNRQSAPCCEIKTNINCTNLDFSRDTVAICGIDLSKGKEGTPVVKLYDLNNLTGAAPAQSAFKFSTPTGTSTFGSTATTGQSAFGMATKPATTTGTSAFGTTTTTGTSAFGTTTTTGTSAFGTASTTGTSAFGTTATTGTSTFGATTSGTTTQEKSASHFILEHESKLPLLQYTSIVLDRSGRNFVAGTLGGFIVSSKTIAQPTNTTSTFGTSTTQYKEEYAFEDVFLFPPKRKPATGTAFAQPQKEPEVFEYNAINCLAILRRPIQSKDKTITANAIFAGMSNGFVQSLTGFRRNTNSQNKKDLKGISDISSNYFKINKGLPVTACDVTPNGKFIVYAKGDDYCEGIKNFFPENKQVPTKVVIKQIDVTAEFVNSNRF